MQTGNSETNETDSHRLNHPSAEEWMASLYGELPSQDAARLTAHLGECPDCRARMERWKSTKLGLDDYALPARLTPRNTVTPLVKWGVAAAFAFGLGLGLGQVFSPTPANAATLKSEMTAEISTRLEQFQQAADERRAADSRAILAALKQMDTARVGDFVSLRKDLETMAVLTQSSLQQTQRELVSLATSQPEFKAPEQ